MTEKVLADDTPLADVGLSVRAANVLLRDNNYRTVGEIRYLTDRQLLQLPNFGRRSLSEVREKLGLGPTFDQRTLLLWRLDSAEDEIRNIRAAVEAIDR